jgi:CRISPR-associated protein (TIGR02710 family)
MPPDPPADSLPPAPASPPLRALLVSLGGSPQPVIFTLNRQRPERILFFVSPASAADIQTVIQGLQYRCADFDRIVTPSADLLAESYRAVRGELPAKLAQWGIAPEELTVDYTGGTKSMSAALVLATAARVQRYSYVGGSERDKGGVGVVVDGRETMWYLQNPWKALVEEELGRVRLAFRTARYAAACEELEALAASPEGAPRLLLQALAGLAAGYREWDAFRHRAALAPLGRACEFLKTYGLGAQGGGWAELAAAVAGHLAFLQRLAPGKGAAADPAALVLDLLANADRRARIEKKFEDAAARLYSCLERAARFRLLARTPPLDNENLSPAAVPPPLRAELERRHADPATGLLKLPLVASYRLLDALGDGLGERFRAREEEILGLLQMRNRSILGHGEQAVSATGAGRFREVLVALLAIDERELPVFPELPEVLLP